jgi:hypothetical protein
VIAEHSVLIVLYISSGGRGVSNSRAVPLLNTCGIVRKSHWDAVIAVFSDFELESDCPQPHLSLAFSFANDLSGKTKTRGKMSVAFHFKNDIVDDIVHGSRRRKELGE